MKPQGLNKEFCVIGENIHTTRVLLRNGKFVGPSPSGEEAVRYTTAEGDTRYLVIPEEFKVRQDYQEGRVKHVMVAVQTAMAGGEEGIIYLRSLLEKQVKGGADFLDLNVDEISTRREEQKEAMRWLVRTIEPLSPVLLSIDSSSLEILMAGIEACQGKVGLPLLNSASLERIEALDVAAERDLPVIATAAGGTGMPKDAEERIGYASRMVDAALAKGIPAERIHVDALVFPISVDSDFGNHCLEAIRQIRSKYGEGIHITGGFSNVSFGLPCRKLINAVFLNLAVAAGADSGIVDPVANDMDHVFLSDKESRPYQLAEDMLVGRDLNCASYLEAYREGDLEPALAT